MPSGDQNINPTNPFGNRQLDEAGNIVLRHADGVPDDCCCTQECFILPKLCDCEDNPPVITPIITCDAFESPVPPVIDTGPPTQQQEISGPSLPPTNRRAIIDPSIEFPIIFEFDGRCWIIEDPPNIIGSQPPNSQIIPRPSPQFPTCEACCGVCFQILEKCDCDGGPGPRAKITCAQAAAIPPNTGAVLAANGFCYEFPGLEVDFDPNIEQLTNLTPKDDCNDCCNLKGCEICGVTVIIGQSTIAVSGSLDLGVHWVECDSCVAFPGVDPSLPEPPACSFSCTPIDGPCQEDACPVCCNQTSACFECNTICNISGTLTLVECDDALQKAIFVGPITKDVGIPQVESGLADVSCHPDADGGCNCVEPDDSQNFLHDCIIASDPQIIQGTIEVEYTGRWRVVNVGYCSSVPNNLVCCTGGITLTDLSVVFKDQGCHNCTCNQGWDSSFTYACGPPAGVQTICAQTSDPPSQFGEAVGAASVFIQASFSAQMNP